MIQIDLFSDVICPWCFIGKRRLERALKIRSNSKVNINWRAFQLNPDMPKNGIAREQNIEEKFGGPERAKSIYDNISYGPTIHGLAENKTDMDEIVENSLKKAALWNEVKDRLNEAGTGLSGGQQQRLCIARAISVNPQVILMDEPCSALDPIATAKIEELIDELKKSYTIVIVTHSMSQAVRVSQRTGFFHLGKIIEVDTTEKIFKNPGNKMTQDYITGRFG